MPNSSFEEVRKAHCLFSGTERLSTYFNDWDTPTAASTDGWYYDPMSSSCTQNTAKFGIKPHSGSHCIGLLAATILPETISNPSFNSEYREYAQVKLTEPLRVGHIYYAEMYVLPLSVSEVFNNNVGMCFSIDSIQQYVAANGFSFTQRLPYLPLINESKVLANQNQWVKISGCFKATHAYTYITIGNFFTNSNTSFAVNSNPTFLTGRSRVSCYYLIDDILVRESTVDKLPNVFNRNIDTTICNNIPLTINPLGLDSTKILWENGSSTPKRVIQQSGTYWITASRGECTHTDTLCVRQENNPILAKDTILCTGEVLQISVNHPLKSYLWDNGSTDSTIRVDKNGTYKVRVVSSNCQLSDEIKVDFVDCPGTELIPNTITPNGDGKNDFFYIRNIELTPWQLEIYNRWGTQVYYSQAYHNEWDAGDLSGGVYFYSLQSKKLKRFLKGCILVLR